MSTFEDRLAQAEAELELEAVTDVKKKKIGSSPPSKLRSAPAVTNGGASPSKTQQSQPSKGSSSPSKASQAASSAKDNGKTPPPPKAPPQPLSSATPAPNGWKRLLTTKKNGDIVPSPSNAHLVFTNDPQWRGVLAFDDFIGDVVTRKLPPWPRDLQPEPFRVGDFSDMDVWRARVWLERNHGFDVHANEVGRAIQLVAERVRSHPVKEYLEGLKWDSKPRLDRWLIDVGGAEDTPYVQAVGKNFLISAVARIYDPGCQVDSMPIFEGKQGAGKTTMVKILAGEWFLSTNIEIGNKDAYQLLKRKWIVEMGELDALSRAEISHVKQYISQATDTYRASYAKKSADHPRQSVFAGTVNPEDGTGYLKDNTGARRFWPVLLGTTHAIRLDELLKQRNSLFAEAVYRYKLGEKWHLTDLELVKAAAVEAESRRQLDPWEEGVARWIKINASTTGDRRRGITTHEILTKAFAMDIANIERHHEMRVASALRMIGWNVVTRETVTGVTTRVYRPELNLQLATVKKTLEKPTEGSEEPMRRQYNHHVLGENNDACSVQNGSPNEQNEPKGVQGVQKSFKKHR